jgi:hypothetical protein
MSQSNFSQIFIRTIMETGSPFCHLCNSPITDIRCFHEITLIHILSINSFQRPL